MKVLISGASGLIGSALVASFHSDGHEVVRLVRGDASGPGRQRWDPAHRQLDRSALDGVDVIVNLSGAPIAGAPWTKSRRKEILASRVDSTSTLVSAAVDRVNDGGPRVLVSGSAIGFYGDTGELAVDETAPHGTGFLADVVQQWEAATTPASDAGIRVALIRTGVVLSEKGGAVKTLGLPFKLGFGGKVGSGRQWVSWISLHDEVRAIRWIVEHDLSGPINLTGPEPATNSRWTKAMGAAMHRPTVLPLPGFALSTALGDMAKETILVSQRVLPAKLTDSGFSFDHNDVEAAMNAALV